MSERPIITFAHRGGMAHRLANTLPAFRNALRMGCGAVETDAWITKDGVVVLDHDGEFLHNGQMTRVADLNRADLPRRVPTLAEYYAAVGTDLELSIDVEDAAAAAAIVDVATAAGGRALDRLWLCYGGLRELSSWRTLSPRIHLVHSTWGDDIVENPGPHAAELARRGIDAMNLHEDDCSATIAAACHASGVLLFGWNAHTESRAVRLVAMGVDGIYGNNIRALMAAVAGRGRQLA